MYNINKEEVTKTGVMSYEVEIKSFFINQQFSVYTRDEDQFYFFGSRLASALYRYRVATSDYWTIGGWRSFSSLENFAESLSHEKFLNKNRK